MERVGFTAPRQLRDEDVIDGFACGVTLVDEWLAKRARTARRAGTAIVYASFCDTALAGFYSLSAQSMYRGNVRWWLARNTPEQIPVILLGMLGVDRRFQGCGLGHDLLLDATQRSVRISQELGARALVVDPVGEQSRAFYLRYGFRDIPGCERMFAKLQ